MTALGYFRLEMLSFFGIDKSLFYIFLIIRGECLECIEAYSCSGAQRR